MISEPAGAKNALKTYAGSISLVPQMKQRLYGIMMLGGKEMVGMVDFIEKYRDSYTAEKADKIAYEIEDLIYSPDAQERMTALVKAERNIIIVSLLPYKKSMQWSLAMLAKFNRIKFSTKQNI